MCWDKILLYVKILTTVEFLFLHQQSLHSECCITEISLY